MSDDKKIRRINLDGKSRGKCWEKIKRILNYAMDLLQETSYDIFFRKKPSLPHIFSLILKKKTNYKVAQKFITKMMQLHNYK